MEKIYPFAGMDPYLEAPDIWPDFHERLGMSISEVLNDTLPEPYYARIEMRAELGIIFEQGAEKRIVPDVLVVTPPMRPANPSFVAASPQTRAAVTDVLRVRVNTEPFSHHFVEVRDAARGHVLVTLIEIVSPSNKRSGADRRAYQAKQREVLDSDAHLIELDLIRAGRRLLPYPDLEDAVFQMACDYLVLLNRSELRKDTWMDYYAYAIDLREMLPVIAVPLRQEEPDVPLDLQFVAQRAYRGGPYLRAIDYTQLPPEPPFTPEKLEWIDARLRAAKLRV